MPIGRHEMVSRLAALDAATLRAVLEEARVEVGTATTPRELAETIASAVWWQYCTPLGYAAGSTTLDDIVDHVARKLQVEGALSPGDGWARLTALADLLVAAPGPASLEDLAPQHRARLTPSWGPTAGYATGATGSFGAMAAGKTVVWISRTTVGRLLPLVPTVGPWVRGVYSGGAIAAAVGGPAGLALSLLAANHALGTNYHRLVPLLVGVGKLRPGRVVDAAEVVEAASDVAPDPA